MEDRQKKKKPKSLVGGSWKAKRWGGNPDNTRKGGLKDLCADGGDMNATQNHGLGHAKRKKKERNHEKKDTYGKEPERNINKSNLRNSVRRGKQIGPKQTGMGEKTCAEGDQRVKKRGDHFS